MGNSSRPPANAFVRVARRIYNPIGFSKGYNFVLFFIFAGAMTGFVLARLQFLSFYGVFCSTGSSSASSHAAPGECFYYLSLPVERIGIIMHLATVLPAGLLACVQFVPVVRHKAMLFHRLNGYVILVLSAASTAGALMIARHAFGGTLPTQAAAGFTSIIFIGSLVMAYINIKRLQIEQHRAWMLRAWFYAGSIITMRMVLSSAASIISITGGFYMAKPCDLLYDFIGDQNRTISRYPECASFFSGANPDQHAAVKATMNGRVEEVAAALNLNFGMGMWIALALHAIGVEIYLKLTPAEAERLRNVSYQRQLEAGMKNPGNAGLTANRLGDANEWKAKETTDITSASSAE